jgi:hypothetical protein
MANFYDIFNKKLIEFINDLIYICPEVDDFKSFKIATHMSACTAPKLPQKMFNECVVQPYSNKIVERDENFFLTESYSNFDDYFKEFGYTIDIVGSLKSIWKTLDDENKKTIWKYLQILMQISNKCISPI